MLFVGLALLDSHAYQPDTRTAYVTMPEKNVRPMYLRNADSKYANGLGVPCNQLLASAKRLIWVRVKTPAAVP